MASRKVLIDSSILYAFIDRSDANHPQATRLLEQLSNQNMFVFTSYFHIQEVYNAISKHIGMAIAIDFLEALTDSDIEVLYPQKSDFLAAVRLIKANRNKEIPFKEAVTASIMQKRSITQIATFTYWHNLAGTSTSNMIVANGYLR